MPMPLTHVAPVAHDESAAVLARRRRVVAAVSVAGAGLLGVSLSSDPGSRRFYATSLGVAGLWAAGGVASGPLHLGWIQGRDQQLRRPVLTPVATGVGAFAFFSACALAAGRLGILDRRIADVLAYAEQGRGRWVLLTTLANGLGEEVFFRGALYAALPGARPAVSSTAVYTLATTATRNPALVLAAAVMGSLFGLQRRASGGVQAPLLTHLTWSALMVRLLPRLFRRASP
jgi:membrane protease YdiL (CAAX protease family)